MVLLSTFVDTIKLGRKWCTVKCMKSTNLSTSMNQSWEYVIEADIDFHDTIF